MIRPSLHIVPDVAAAALEAVLEAFASAGTGRERLVLCLPGGGTPLPTYRALAAHRDLAWHRVWLVVGDERWVPPDHPERNERALRRALIDHVPVPEAQVLTWPWDESITPEQAAARYEERVRGALDDAAPFDLTLLGLGADGHTAGLFPGTGATAAPGWATASRPASQPTPRLSLTPAALSRSRRVLFLVSGEAKRPALRALLAPREAPDEEEARERTPARSIGALESLEVLSDVAP